MKSFSLNRRAVLRGTGVTMALPLLEAMLPTGKTAFAAEARPPKFLAYFTSCGILAKHFAMPIGPITQLSPTLADFEDLKDKISQVRGVASPKAGAGGDHSGGCQSWLRAGGSGASVDQIAHQAHMRGPMNDRTRFGSLAVGVNGGCFAQDLDGGPRALCSVSWTDSNTIVTKDFNPQALFNKLFGSDDKWITYEAEGSRAALNESVLSYVKDEAKKLQQKMGSTDKQIIERYFTGIEELERQLPPLSSCIPPTPPDPTSVTKPLIAKALADLTILAFQCDLARYGSFMLENGGDYTTYTHLGATTNHHELSHQGDSNTLARIERWMLGEMAYLVRGLNNTKDLTGESLLDSCTVMLGNEVSDGQLHTHTNMPFIIAGSCNGYFKMGQTIQSGGNYGDVWVQVLDALGYRSSTGKFGNSTGRIPVEIMS